MNAKPWYQSKTILVNLVVLVALAVLGVIQEAQGELNWQVVIAAIIAGLNVVLRFVTEQPIGNPASSSAPSPLAQQIAEDNHLPPAE